MDDPLECELEALQETFDVTVTEHPGYRHKLSMKLVPYTGDEDVFVETDLTICLDHMYPESIPEVAFYNPKGLSDERLQTLRNAAKDVVEELVGEPVLMMMCMASKDALSAMNFPEGSCPFCLEPMHHAPECFCGPCFHGYHNDCFRRWWLWLVQKHQEEERICEQSRNRVGLGCIQKDKWDARSVECPVCRIQVPHTLLQRLLLPEELEQGHPDPGSCDSWRQDTGPGGVSLQGTQGADILENLLPDIQTQQESRRRVLEVQEQCGGLVKKFDAL